MMIAENLYTLLKDVDFIERQQLKLDSSYSSADFRRYQNDQVCKIKNK
jgi:hypothetical protein